MVACVAAPGEAALPWSHSRPHAKVIVLLDTINNSLDLHVGHLKVLKVLAGMGGAPLPQDGETELWEVNVNIESDSPSGGFHLLESDQVECQLGGEWMSDFYLFPVKCRGEV